jgi:hypothetical protein
MASRGGKAYARGAMTANPAAPAVTVTGGRGGGRAGRAGRAAAGGLGAAIAPPTGRGSRPRGGKITTTVGGKGSRGNRGGLAGGSRITRGGGGAKVGALGARGMKWPSARLVGKNAGAMPRAGKRGEFTVG